MTARHEKAHDQLIARLHRKIGEAQFFLHLMIASNEVIDPIAGARVRARRKWPVSGESGRVHDPIATRPKHDLQRDR
jgi:hypothetical protein